MSSNRHLVETAVNDLKKILHALYLEWTVLLEQYQSNDERHSSSAAPMERGSEKRRTCELVLKQVLVDTQVMAAMTENLLDILFIQWNQTLDTSGTDYENIPQLTMILLECISALQKSKLNFAVVVTCFLIILTEKYTLVAVCGAAIIQCRFARGLYSLSDDQIHILRHYIDYRGSHEQLFSDHVQATSSRRQSSSVLMRLPWVALATTAFTWMRRQPLAYATILGSATTLGIFTYLLLHKRDRASASGSTNTVPHRNDSFLNDVAENGLESVDNFDRLFEYIDSLSPDFNDETESRASGLATASSENDHRENSGAFWNSISNLATRVFGARRRSSDEGTPWASNWREAGDDRPPWFGSSSSSISDQAYRSLRAAQYPDEARQQDIISLEPVAVPEESLQSTVHDYQDNNMRAPTFAAASGASATAAFLGNYILENEYEKDIYSLSRSCFEYAFAKYISQSCLSQTSPKDGSGRHVQWCLAALVETDLRNLMLQLSATETMQRWYLSMCITNLGINPLRLLSEEEQDYMVGGISTENVNFYAIYYVSNIDPESCVFKPSTEETPVGKVHSTMHIGCRAPDSLNCCICLQPMVAGELLIRNTNPSCGASHVFHRKCLPESYASEHGCPLCRNKMYDMQETAINSPFSYEDTGMVHFWEGRLIHSLPYILDALKKNVPVLSSKRSSCIQSGQEIVELCGLLSRMLSAVDNKTSTGEWSAKCLQQDGSISERLKDSFHVQHKTGINEERMEHELSENMLLWSGRLAFANRAPTLHASTTTEKCRKELWKQMVDMNSSR